MFRKGRTVKSVVLVNGVPASGKSAVTAILVRHLTDAGIPAVPFTLDTVKECLYDHVGIGDRDHNRMLGRASYQSIFANIGAFPNELVPVIDAWHGFLPIVALRDHLAEAQITHVVEIWCKVSPKVAAERYIKRASRRTEGHPPASYADELFELASRAHPLSLGPVVQIDTEKPVDSEPLARVQNLLRGDPG